MSDKRKVFLTGEDLVLEELHWKNQVLIKVEDKAKTRDYVRTAIRMAPDQIVIDKSLFGCF